MFEIKKIKILFIVPRFGTIHRGLETYTKELISNLDKSKFCITILSALHEEKFQDVIFEKYKTINRERFDWIFKYKIVRKLLSHFNIYGSSDFESISLLFKCLKFLKHSNFDFILPFGGYWSYWLVNKYIDKRKTKVISVGQASVVRKDILQSDYFIALTPFAYEEACQTLNQNKIVLIPNGVDTRKFQPSERIIKNTILCVAAFSSDKNHVALLNALSKMPSSIRLILIGSGPLEDNLKDHPVCKSHNVVFKSSSLNEMPLIYKEASIFTLAATQEAFGIVFLEALASGLNVVAHDAPRQRFVIGDKGFYCNVNDANEYSEMLMKALNINQKMENVLQAKKFSWEAISLKYEEFFIKVKNGNSL